MLNIEKNIKTRKAVETLLDFAPDLLTPDIDEDKFWLELASRAAMHTEYELRVGGSIQVMSYEEGIKFEQTLVPFGMYAGQRVCDVDCEYWLYITESDFNKNLVRYLRSKRFKDLQDA